MISVHQAYKSHSCKSRSLLTAWWHSGNSVRSTNRTSSRACSTESLRFVKETHSDAMLQNPAAIYYGGGSGELVDVWQGLDSCLNIQGQE